MKIELSAFVLRVLKVLTEIGFEPEYVDIFDRESTDPRITGVMIAIPESGVEDLIQRYSNSYRLVGLAGRARSERYGRGQAFGFDGQLHLIHSRKLGGWFPVMLEISGWTVPWSEVWRWNTDGVPERDMTSVVN